jgi:hypothetical protein
MCAGAVAGQLRRLLPLRCRHWRLQPELEVRCLARRSNLILVDECIVQDMLPVGSSNARRTIARISQRDL